MKGVILYKCGRNLNRVIRTCYTFGVYELLLLECDKSYIKGNCYSANGKVNVREITSIADVQGKIVGLETKQNDNIEIIKNADYLLVGGENVSIKKDMCNEITCIKTVNNLCLTVEAATAIDLFYATR